MVIYCAVRCGLDVVLYGPFVAEFAGLFKGCAWKREGGHGGR